MPRFLIFFLTAAALAGCTGGPPLPPVSAAHPASPGAEEAPYVRAESFAPAAAPQPAAPEAPPPMKHMNMEHMNHVPMPGDAP